MSLKQKKIVVTLVFCLVAIVSTLTVTVMIADAVGADPLVYQDGTSYQSSHSMQDTTIWNYADEAHGLYIFYQNCDLLPVQVHYSIISHEVAEVNLTMSCTIETEITYKWLWFNKSITKSTHITGDEIVKKGYVTGYLEGPNSDATSIRTVYCYLDAAEGKCTWTIVGE